MTDPRRKDKGHNGQTGGAINRDSMMARRKEIADIRNTKLKVIFTADQMKKWTDETGPSLRPQRGNGQRPK